MLKSVLLSNIKDRFATMCEQPLFIIATVVDLHYQLKFFSEALQKSVTELLIAKVWYVALQCQQLTATASCLPR